MLGVPLFFEPWSPYLKLAIPKCSRPVTPARVCPSGCKPLLLQPLSSVNSAYFLRLHNSMLPVVNSSLCCSWLATYSIHRARDSDMDCCHINARKQRGSSKRSASVEACPIRVCSMASKQAQSLIFHFRECLPRFCAPVLVCEIRFPVARSASPKLLQVRGACRLRMSSPLSSDCDSAGISACGAFLFF